ncbi:[protein-PII] uridylyltransferase family protein [Deferrisoma camini]|uniref:[protein-PII] uridylyltransferase family protein n=1 Tax=Deferrisoma camini TaxID=1035120 RepID=UPI00046D340D|nr:ACT domain-containing protein [Deferrisoma camini]
MTAPLSAWKDRLAEARHRLASGRASPAEFARLVDELVGDLARAAGWDGPGRAVVALGGYGRREMAPRSDVDLLFLAGRSGTAPEVEPVLYPLWDLGLDVGHALRTPADCRDVARQDLTAATALLDARLLLGDPDLFERTLRRAGAKPRPSRRTRAWARAVIEDVEARRKRFGEISHLLEPHVKEGWGGLRDLQAARWVLACLGLDPHREIARLPRGPQALEGARLLDRVRAAIHGVAGRKTDHLTFEHHEAVARIVVPGERPEELFARLHRAARDIAALWQAVADGFPHPPRVATATEGFDDPARAASALQGPQGPDGKPRPSVMARLAASPAPVRRAALREALGRLFRRRAASHPLLDALLDHGLLGDVDPLLGEAAHAVPYDARHAFTVGAHGVECLAAFERLWLGALEDREPWLTRVAGGLPAPWVLRVAALTHDLGKCVSAGDHARSGASHAERIARALGLSDEEAREAARLVEHHHAVPLLAFRRDPDDPRTAREAWKIAGTPERLDALVVLAYADLASTHPGPHHPTWTAWTRNLLLALHSRARTARADPAVPADALREQLARACGGAAERALVDEVPTAELLQVPPDLLGRLVRMTARLGDAPCRWETVATPFGPVEVLGVISAPPPWALSATSAALTRLGFDIRMFQVHAWPRGLLHLWFRCHPPDHPPGRDRLRQALDEALTAGRPRPRRPGLVDRRMAAMPVPTRVDLTHGSPVHSVIEVTCRDRPGLLAALTAALDELGLTVVHAMVTTQGPQARDVFHVRDLLGGRIEGEDKKKRILARLRAAVETEP